MIVNSENINRLMDCAWRDANGKNKTKESSGETTILCYRVSSPISRLDYSKQMISAGDMKMAHYEHAITILHAQPHRTPTKSMNIIGAKIPCKRIRADIREAYTHIYIYIYYYRNMSELHRRINFFYIVGTK